MNTRLQRWLWPVGMAGQLTLLLVLLLLLVFWVGGALYMSNRAETAAELLKESVAQRIAVIVPLIERTPVSEREHLLRAIHSPTLRVRLTDNAWPASQSRVWAESGALMQTLRERLPDLGDRTVEIRAFAHWRAPPPTAFRDGPGRPPHELLHSRARARVSVALTTGGWIHFVVAAPALSLRWALRAAFWAAAASVVIVIAAFWMTARTTRPLRRFADAAERLGLNTRSPPLREEGSREVRNAARAFNRMQERVRQLVDGRTMMLAAISHDLRTLLTRLRLRAEFIGDSEQQAKAVADLDTMQSMLDSTLAFAREDAADEPRTATDLGALVQSLCDDCTDAGQRVACTSTGPTVVTCAPQEIRRALRNILDNAIKYGSEAEVRVSGADDGVMVEIADRGPGIPAHQREEAFDPFHRLDPARSHETSGSGLGLTVARSVIRRHGGTITMTDRTGGGLVVTVDLPRSNSD